MRLRFFGGLSVEEAAGRPEPNAPEAPAGETAPQAVATEAGRPAKDEQAARPATVKEAGRPADEDAAVEMTQEALRTLGFRRRDARERAEAARERLLRGGRTFLTADDCSDLLREAFRSP